MIDGPLIGEVVATPEAEAWSFSHLGGLDSKQPNTLSFIESAKYLQQLASNPNITGVFVTPGLVDRVQAPTKIVCDDPRYFFSKLHNLQALRNYVKKPNAIDPCAVIHPSAYIADHNVAIGPGCVIEVRAVVLAPAWDAGGPTRATCDESGSPSQRLPVRSMALKNGWVGEMERSIP